MHVPRDLKRLSSLLLLLAGCAVLHPLASAHAQSKPAGFLLVPPWAEGQEYQLVIGYGGNSNHQSEDYYALDFLMPDGTPVHASAPGRVIAAGETGSGYGKAVLINHAFAGESTTYQTLYAHLSHVEVQANDFVDAGELIGLSGIGQGTAHLHFAMRQGATGWYSGTAVNPEPFVSCTATRAPGGVVERIPCGDLPGGTSSTALFQGYLWNDLYKLRRDYSPPAVVRDPEPNGLLLFHVFTRTPSNALCHCSYTWTSTGLASPACQNIGGVLTSGPTAVMDASSDEPSAFVVGLEGEVWNIRRRATGWSQSDWRRLDQAHPYNTVRARGRIAAWYNSGLGRVEVFARASDNSIRGTSVSNGSWSGAWTHYLGVVSSEPVVFRDAGGNVHVYSVGMNYDGWEMTPFVNPNWSQLWGQSLIGPVSPVVYQGANRVYAWSTLNSSVAYTPSGSYTSPWAYLPGVNNGRPAPIVDANNNLRVFYRGGTRHEVREYNSTTAVDATIGGSARVLSEPVVRKHSSGLVVFAWRSGALYYKYEQAGTWSGWLQTSSCP